MPGTLVLLDVNVPGDTILVSLMVPEGTMGCMKRKLSRSRIKVRDVVSRVDSRQLDLFDSPFQQGGSWFYENRRLLYVRQSQAAQDEPQVFAS